MDRKLARKNLRTALLTTAVIMFMFGMSFVAAWLYNLP
jgi:cytochrome c oxidase assembly protein Cox11